ncbi:MAG: hypothetical protein J5915_11520, partial [Acidaminococcaceae bacterium]|nr:hypothetical protein [Acidaminococcaceae bacterium]
IQWGTINGPGTVNFPISFPSVCYACVKQWGGSSELMDAPYANQAQIMNLTNTGFKQGPLHSTLSPAYWIAIGK